MEILLSNIKSWIEGKTGKIFFFTHIELEEKKKKFDGLWQCWCDVW